MPRESRSLTIVVAAVALVLLGGMYLLFDTYFSASAPVAVTAVVPVETPPAQKVHTTPPSASVEKPPLPLAPMPPPDARGLRGSVANVDGSPAAGAEVWAYSTSLPRDFATATTDDAGRFTLPKLQHKTYDVVATRGDDCAIEQGIPADMDLSMQLARRGTVLVTAQDELAQRVEGVKLFLEISGDKNPAQPNSEIQTRVNTEFIEDENHQYTCQVGLPGSYVLHASAPSGASGVASFSWEPPSPGADVEVRVTAGVEFSGTVVNRKGQPISGAFLLLLQSQGGVEEEPFDAHKVSGAPQAASDAGGAFTIERVPPGIYTLNVTEKGHAVLDLPGIEVASQPIKGYRVILMAGGTVRGTYTSRGVPVEGVIMLLRNSAFSGAAHTDPDGRFTIEHAPEGRFALTAMLSNLAGTSTPRPRVVQVIDDEITEVDFDNSGVTVSGGVAGIQEGDMAIVRVVEPGLELPPTFGPRAINDPDVLGEIVAQSFVREGAFQLDGVSPGTYTLEVFTFEFTPASPEDITLGADADTPRIRQSLTVGDSPVQLQLALP